MRESDSVRERKGSEKKGEEALPNTDKNRFKLSISVDDSKPFI